MDGSSYGRHFVQAFWTIVAIVAVVSLIIGVGIGFTGSILGWW